MFKFKYQFQRGDTRDNTIFDIQAQKERTCAKPINTFGNFCITLLIKLRVL